ncbi:MAG: hypothetical protein DMG97_19675 [Acidobacteria bacterium]|nr:MAG: hypothetical protein DMG98_21250 [Acidobacteriota bacterium]PYV70284.1 MAG: hypothetical protein DMG97_19675 [Acidobacteriota bacterium]PYV80308.1 MAG: hypothetical protein DMG96_01195 [Acidobacteriota bacterium]
MRLDAERAGFFVLAFVPAVFFLEGVFEGLCAGGVFVCAPAAESGPTWSAVGGAGVRDGVG